VAYIFLTSELKEELSLETLLSIEEEIDEETAEEEELEETPKAEEEAEEEEETSIPPPQETKPKAERKATSSPKFVLRILFLRLKVAKIFFDLGYIMS
jgi:hemolysin activation/secretion protein